MFARGYVVAPIRGGLLAGSFLIMMLVRASPSAVPAHCAADVGLRDPQHRQVQVLCGDYTVRAARETWEPKRHYKVFGNLIIPANKVLDIRDSLVEIISEYAREHVVFIGGGTLSTVNTQIGGTMREGVYIQTIFIVESDAKAKVYPRWTSSNTVVQYSYGILQNAGTLEASNLQQGPSPDAIILGGASTATLHGGTFNIALRADARAGTDSVLDLPSNRALTAVYSAKEPEDSGHLVPGTQSRVELDGTTVPLWFLFINNVTTEPSPRTTIRLRDVQTIIPAIHTVDFNGEMKLRTTWVDDTPKWNPALPAGTISTAGNVTVRTERGGTALPCWAVYLAKTSKGTAHAILRGPTAVCELFTYEGTRVEVLGTNGKFDAHLNATTIELSKNSSILARNVVIGPLLNRDERGHIGAKEPGAVMQIEKARLRDIDTLSDTRATVSFADSVPFTFADGSRAAVSSRGKAPTFLRSALGAVSPSETLRNDLQWAGLRFRVGSQSLRVTRLGRYRNAGDASAHEVRLYRADGRLLDRVTLQASSDTDYLGFNYASLRSAITLEPNAEFILVSREGGRDRFDDATMVTPQAGDLFVIGAVSSVDGVSFQSGRPNQSYGPLNFQYVDEGIVIN
jgi:hypothetical protein